MIKPNVNIRNYLPGDEHLIDVQDVQKSRFRHSMIAELLAHGGASTIVVDHKVLAIGGIAHTWDGRSVAWGYVDKNMPRRAWPQVNILARKMLGLHRETSRIECWVKCTPPGLWSFAKKLGFKEESIMKNFHNGDDYIMGVLSWPH